MERTTGGRGRVEVYGRTARGLHWVTVILLAVQLPVGFYMTYRGGTLNLWDSLTNTLYSAHKLGGVLILLLVAWRLVHRLRRGAPADEPSLPGWQRRVAHLTHWGLYLLLLAVPVAGYIGISRFPALEVFGLFSLPSVAAPDKDAAATAFLVHAWLAWALLVLVAMHVGAALQHHFIRRDDVLARMLPSLLRR